ncbi:D-aminoacyl-tRNA deacylase [Bacillus carboniphilus]|uniref:D-aminoacyl-tRNA deacylase n=1 Tax=Bacillus carboniphilus TaxID=86663 RepID=A0ABY9JXE8_9BACI|nr:D-aminoacyl-tRNA deacylase [Bacillus carboniphilus]WLR44051.1 D-aminoacyl-tRNA deacylase [Bacillus carboniphilus]
MKVILQRAKEAKVTVNDQVVGEISSGILLLVGITHDDTEKEAEYLANKIVHLRIFPDETGKMNRSLLDIKGEILSVSQFTLYGDCSKGRRPNFMGAAKGEHALQIFDRFNELLRNNNLTVETGSFGEMMDVSFTNDGPVTLILESK